MTSFDTGGSDFDLTILKILMQMTIRIIGSPLPDPIIQSPDPSPHFILTRIAFLQNQSKLANLLS